MRRFPFLLVAVAGFLSLPAGPALAAAREAAASPPVNSSLPVVSGTARSGQTLSASSGSWGGVTPIAYAYGWERCNSSGSSCAAISGASSQNYVASSGDVGRTIRVEVTASNADGKNQALSGATAAIAAPGAAPANTKQPNPSGTAQEGQTIKVDNGAWSGQTPITFTYQWQSCTAVNPVCTDLSGATDSSYLIGTGQVGSALRATVTATSPAGKTAASSNLTTAVLAKSTAPVNSRLPVISGSAVVGNTLQASTGIWSGVAAGGFGFQWSRCNLNGTSCAGISGATGQSYGVGLVDRGNALRVTVTATNSTGPTSATSAAMAIRTAAVRVSRFNAVLRRGQEVYGTKATSARAAGHFSAKVTGKKLRWTLTFSHLSGRPTVTGLNRGRRGSTGAAFKTLCRRCLSPARGTLTLTTSQLAALLQGRAYVNIHTARNRRGEIRGQITHVG